MGDERGIFIDQNGNGTALNIDSETTTAEGIIVDCSALTTGKALMVNSNSSSSATRQLVRITNDHNSATGTTNLYVDNDSDGFVADFHGTAGIRSAAGISFGTDTAAANRLDDYEEGTFTPTLIDTSNNEITSYTTQTGKYTKIGSMVSIQVEIEINTFGSLGGNYMKVSALPFTPSNSPTYRPLTTHWNGINTDTWGFYASVYGGNAFAYLFQGSDDDSTDQLEPSEFANGDSLVLNGWYNTV